MGEIAEQEDVADGDVLMQRAGKELALKSINEDKT